MWTGALGSPAFAAPLALNTLFPASNEPWTDSFRPGDYIDNAAIGMGVLGGRGAW
jgi:hypothetical protein